MPSKRLKNKLRRQSKQFKLLGNVFAHNAKMTSNKHSKNMAEICWQLSEFCEELTKLK